MSVTQLPVSLPVQSRPLLPSLAGPKAVQACSNERALDWLSFFIAAVQVGFGPFMAVYFTEHAWTQGDIGLVLTISGLVALAAQMPGGALVDAAPSPRLLAGIAVATNAVSALMIAASSTFSVAISSYVLLAAVTSVLGPAIVAISLGVVGHEVLGKRLGRNARFAALGSGAAAAAMGACGHFISTRAVLFFAAALTVPAIATLTFVRARMKASPPRAAEKPTEPPLLLATALKRLVGNRAMLVFTAGIVLFQLANVALLPLLGGVMAHRSSEWATTSIAAGMVVPQVLVAAISPWVGEQAASHGRRPFLMACFAALALRAALFAFVTSPPAIVAVQALDGISAAVVGVLFPLVIVDLTRDTGHLNLALGFAGTAVGIGASLSTTLGGYLADHFGVNITFLVLAGVAAAGLVLLSTCMPETRPNGRE